MEQIKVLVSGAYGRMGREVVKAVCGQPDMELVGATDKAGIGKDACRAAGVEKTGVIISSDLSETISKTKPQVMVDFTTPLAVMENIRLAAEAGVAGVIGTTGLTKENLEEIASLAAKAGRAFLIAPNFAIGAILMMRFAGEAAKFFTDVEIIELHHDKKIDAPSGTALKTVEAINTGRASRQPPAKPSPLEKIKGARGGELCGVHIHSVRLPGLVAHQEVIFGGMGQTLTIRHDSLDRSSFMPGVLLAIRKVVNEEGLFNGLEAFLR